MAKVGFLIFCSIFVSCAGMAPEDAKNNAITPHLFQIKAVDFFLAPNTNPIIGLLIKETKINKIESFSLRADCFRDDLRVVRYRDMKRFTTSKFSNLFVGSEKEISLKWQLYGFYDVNKVTIRIDSVKFEGSDLIFCNIAQQDCQVVSICLDPERLCETPHSYSEF